MSTLAVGVSTAGASSESTVLVLLCIQLSFALSPGFLHGPPPVSLPGKRKRERDGVVWSNIMVYSFVLSLSVSFILFQEERQSRIQWRVQATSAAWSRLNKQHNEVNTIIYKI